eukprot:1156183-Pelagomonas_calceolata.AAC.3
MLGSKPCNVQQPPVVEEALVVMCPSQRRKLHKLQLVRQHIRLSIGANGHDLGHQSGAKGGLQLLTISHPLAPAHTSTKQWYRPWTECWDPKALWQANPGFAVNTAHTCKCGSISKSIASEMTD